MLISAPGPFQLSRGHPGSRSWQSLQSGSKCLPILLFLSTSFKGSPQQLGLCPLCLLAFSSKAILSILTHHRFSAQDCRKMSLETSLRHEHQDILANSSPLIIPKGFMGQTLMSQISCFCGMSSLPGGSPESHSDRFEPVSLCSVKHSS